MHKWLHGQLPDLYVHQVLYIFDYYILLGVIMNMVLDEMKANNQ